LENILINVIIEIFGARRVYSVADIPQKYVATLGAEQVLNCWAFCYYHVNKTSYLNEVGITG
jgi:hypothetical protein